MPRKTSSFDVPINVQEAARRGLELRRSLPPSKRGGTEVGIARARDLANGRRVSLATVKRMRSFFARHRPDRDAPGWGKDSKGWQAFLLWGGYPGERFADSILRRFDSK